MFIIKIIWSAVLVLFFGATFVVGLSLPGNSIAGWTLMILSPAFFAANMFIIWDKI